LKKNIRFAKIYFKLNPLKKLAGQTAIYGLPTIIGRLLNYFLLPLYTRVFLTEEYGVVTELYAYIAFLMVILTYGMETAFFRFSTKEKGNDDVYNTSVISLLFSSVFFIILTWILAGSIANALGYNGNSSYFVWFAWILGLDALSSIPFARLRQENKAKRFAFLKSINIGLQIGFNLFFIVLCPWLDKISTGLPINYILRLVYSPDVRVGYIFISNLLASIITLVLLLPEIISIKFRFNKALWIKMIQYSFPIMIWGMAGIVNETFDRILLKHLIPESQHPMSQLGIYGACYKIAILMTLFIQTFKFAAEPFFFSQSEKSDAKKVYADVMQYFIMICSLIFLGVMLYIDIVMGLVGKDYRSGAGIVPILLLANLCLGIFYNLSIWYKITDQTKFGAYISMIGAAITLILNFIMVPTMGYMGAAWATLICYFSIMFISYLLGQKYYKIDYNLKKIGLFLGLALLLYFISILINMDAGFLKFVIHTFLLLIYVVVILFSEKKNIRKFLHHE
jgi:O-antigen/teichoic acid export membrane protein